MKSGIQLISEERKDQVKEHGFTPESDQKYVNGELLKAATFCITEDSKHWPKGWDENYMNKIDRKTKVEKLMVAGALIAAEIDRVTEYKPDENVPDVRFKIFQYEKMQVLIERGMRTDDEKEFPIYIKMYPYGNNNITLTISSPEEEETEKLFSEINQGWVERFIAGHIGDIALWFVSSENEE